MLKKAESEFLCKKIVLRIVMLVVQMIKSICSRSARIEQRVFAVEAWKKFVECAMLLAECVIRIAECSCLLA
jgi:hypothetical protein